MRRLMQQGCLVGVFALALFAQATAVEAQTTRAPSGASASDEGFTPGHVDVGPVIGLGGIGDASLSFGGRFEFAFLQLPNFPDGILSIGGGVDHYSYDLGSFGSFSYTPIGVTVNFHYRLENRKIDPFAGFGFGNYIVTAPDTCSAFGASCSYNSGVYPIARAGIRYFWQPNLALYADAGSGAGALHVGLMFKIK
jgi:hypothetical protein